MELTSVVPMTFFSLLNFASAIAFAKLKPIELGVDTVTGFEADAGTVA